MILKINLIHFVHRGFESTFLSFSYDIITKFWNALCPHAVADPGFPRRLGRQSHSGAPTYFLDNFYQNLYENEEIWAERGCAPPPSPIRQCIRPRDVHVASSCFLRLGIVHTERKRNDIWSSEPKSDFLDVCTNATAISLSRLPSVNVKWTSIYLSTKSMTRDLINQGTWLHFQGKMGAPQELSELPLRDPELSKVARGITANFLQPIAVEYLKISQVEADAIYHDCREKVNKYWRTLALGQSKGFLRFTIAFGHKYIT